MLLVLTLVLTTVMGALAEHALDLKQLLKNGAVRIEQHDGTPLIRYRDEHLLVPASIIKVATAFCALELLGPEYRFETLFLTDHSRTLFIKGFGDPSLVSETLEAIAQKIANKIPKIDRIVIDPSYFSDALSIDGSERSLNPYDAKNAAFVGNYASAAITHSKSGVVTSAEQQTPLTPLSRHAGLKLPRGRTDRINLSSDWRTGTRYGGELLAAFLKKHGTRGAMTISLGPVPSTSTLILRHQSPSTLEKIIQGMLEYSTNFTANQLFLVLGAHTLGAPATVQKGQQIMRTCLENRLGWKSFHLEEGSGLSRRTRVSPLHMTQLLKHFERYSQLLPEKEGFLAKTGSLRGVNSLAGYFDLANQPAPVRFAILINSEVPHHYKFHVAKKLREHLTKQ